jgi:hypothetical protein
MYVWNENKGLSTTLHSSARVADLYVVRRRSQGLLKSPLHCKPICEVRNKRTLRLLAVREQTGDKTGIANVHTDSVFCLRTLTRHCTHTF